jgi:putative peptide zinc metalloprotease protein
MSDRIPQLSEAVEIFTFSENEYLLQNKSLGYHVSINQLTYQLIKLIDGKSTIKQIQENFYLKYSINLPIDFIFELLYKRLAKFGVIIQNDFLVTPKERSRHLRLSFIFVSASLLNVITPFFKFLFKRSIFYSFVILLFLFVGTTIVVNYQLIQYWFLNKSFNIMDVSIYFFFFLFSSLFHEIGHASALKFFNKESNGIGFGFYLFTPALFTDVSEAWCLDRKDRVLVNLGGIYFELLLAGVFITFYFLFNDILFLILPCVLTLSTLWNLNPFLKLDGYWLLTDLTNTPNLQSKSFKVLSEMIQNSKRLVFNFKSKKELFLLLYAVTSITFIFLFLFAILINDPYSIFTFPLRVIDIVINYKTLDVILLSKTILIPLVFWYLILSFVIRSFRNFSWNKIIPEHRFKN